MSKIESRPEPASIGTAFKSSGSNHWIVVQRGPKVVRCVKRFSAVHVKVPYRAFLHQRFKWDGDVTVRRAALAVYIETILMRVT